jgi:hypothetical protein
MDKNNWNDPGKVILGFSKYGSLVKAYISLVVGILVTFGFTYLLIKGDADWRFIALSVVFALLVVLITVIRIRRLNKINLNPTIENPVSVTVPSQKGFGEKLVLDDTEKILGSVLGITWGGWRTKMEIMGVGNTNHPENSLFLTNRGIISVVVPVSGAGLSMAGLDFSSMSSAISRGKIEETAKQMMSTMSANQILFANELNYYLPFSSLKGVKFYGLGYKGAVSFEMSDGKKYRYTLWAFKYKEQRAEIEKALTGNWPGKVTTGWWF